MGPCWAHSSTVLDSSYQYYLFHLQTLRVILNERTAHYSRELADLQAYDLATWKLTPTYFTFIEILLPDEESTSFSQ